MKNLITTLHLVICKLHNSTLIQLLIITSNQERTRGDYWTTQVLGKSSGMSVVIKTTIVKCENSMKLLCHIDVGDSPYIWQHDFEQAVNWGCHWQSFLTLAAWLLWYSRGVCFLFFCCGFPLGGKIWVVRDFSECVKQIQSRHEGVPPQIQTQVLALVVPTAYVSGMTEAMPLVAISGDMSAASRLPQINTTLRFWQYGGTFL